MENYNQVFIALGSNLKQPYTQIQSAFHALSCLPNTHFLKRSSLYKSAPVGKLDQPDFINAVALIKTKLKPHDLMIALLKIENNHGRKRSVLNAPRTLDLDILLYENIQLNEKDLTIPHPRMTERAFVLYPLLEISPDCYIPGYTSIKKLVKNLTGQKPEKFVNKTFSL